MIKQWQHSAEKMPTIIWIQLIGRKILVWNVNHNMSILFLSTLHIGRCGSLIFTKKLWDFKSKWTTFFSWRYSIPNAASIAKMSLFRRSMVLANQKHAIVREQGLIVTTYHDCLCKKEYRTISHILNWNW